MSRATYNVVTDARRQAKESAEKGRVFALFLRVHYSDVFPEAGTVVAKKRARKKSKKDTAENDVVQKDAAQGAAQKQTQTLPLAAQANPTPPTGVRAAAAPCWLPRGPLRTSARCSGRTAGSFSAAAPTRRRPASTCRSSGRAARR